ncbi:glycoside hydrolase family 28 protein [Microbacterium invictum]|uniref:Polygalacturonase n=1 Tax=Microbacterium invictum TaxID=515415 RepID=A0AA40SQZ0_9MICO|nr:MULTISPECIES: glycoside hydrolase family 28 protein [Microbacterium]MBB4140812.1 polygalacturonase [Microbacterium invictum]
MTDRKDFDPRTFGAVADGSSDDTRAIQSAIDAAAVHSGRVILRGGTFLTGSLFLASGVDFHLDESAVLAATFDQDAYPNTPSRIAGVEMSWPAAILNVIGAENVTVTGGGLIDGRGSHWWDQFWGPDGKSGLLNEYEERGLRWATDYDCRRPRVILVQGSSRVTIQGISIKRSPFWTVHLLYSNDLTVADVRIDENLGPSTDGIDIDSCARVVIERCEISCADDNISIKSGRDANGLRVDRVCEDIDIRHCVFGEGVGLALGSEVSGGVRNVRIHDVEFDGTDYGIRFKSSRARGGFITDVSVERVTLRDVAYPISLQLNWYPLYNTITVPEDHSGEIPESWRVLSEPLPEGVRPTVVRDIAIVDVTSDLDESYDGPSWAFDIDGLPDAPIHRLRLENVSLRARELGRIIGVRDLDLSGVRLEIEHANTVDPNPNDHSLHHQWRARHRTLPRTVRRTSASARAGEVSF